MSVRDRSAFILATSHLSCMYKYSPRVIRRQGPRPLEDNANRAEGAISCTYTEISVQQRNGLYLAGF